MRSKIQLYINISIITIILASAGSYAFFKTRDMLSGPELSVNYPKNMMTLSDNSTFVTGVAKNTSYISLNGRPFLIDKEGNFKVKVILPDGYSSLALVARDRFDKEVLKNIELIVRSEKKETEILASSTPAEILVKK